MMKGVMTGVVCFVKAPPTVLLMTRFPVLRFLSSSPQSCLQVGLHRKSFLRNSLIAANSFLSRELSTHGKSCYVPPSSFPGRLSLCSTVGRYEGIHSRHRSLRHSWLVRIPSHRRGFGSSTSDVASGAVAAVPPGAGPGLPTPSDAVGDATPGDSGDSVANVAESVRNSLNSLVMASRDAAARMFPEVGNWMDPSSGGVAELLIPASSAIGVSLVAWLLLPKLLRKFHFYVESGPTARLLGRLPHEKQPYELSVFSALDMPARLLASAVTFSYLGYIVAPTSIGAHYLTQIWSGATVISAIWFLYRWKSNAFTRMITGKTISNAERERYLTMDRLSSVGLFVLGAMAFAEACGVAVQSILTVGGIGGVATAFAARDILGNMLSGVALQFSRPFTVGDTISAGSVNGQVVEMGLHTTQLLNSDKFPIVVPNSFFSNQVIINKSRARYRAYSFNLPVHIQDLEKIPSISSEIRQMIESHPKVFLEKEKPRCYVSQVGSLSLNIAVTCNLIPMGTDGYLTAGEELLIESARLVVKAGATLGNPGGA